MAELTETAVCVGAVTTKKKIGQHKWKPYLPKDKFLQMITIEQGFDKTTQVDTEWMALELFENR